MQVRLISATLLTGLAAILTQVIPATESEAQTRAEYRFVRLEYTDLPQHHRRFGWSSRNGTGAGWWMMDWPDAETHFITAVRRLTRIDTGESTHFRLTDARLFEHPWIYATQVGWWQLSDEEVNKLREYLQRGGFLIVDDFWGADQWDVFRRTMERTLPSSPIVDVPDDDRVMHVLYDIQEKDRTFIPGSRHLHYGPDGQVTIEQPPGTTPLWRGIYDGRGRMVVAVSYNMDVADAWEFADRPEYPEHKTSLAYRYGINTIIYAMTH
ncbi:MAG TPA: DUF4159 domain-containing protein [Bryobacteraceae bacterium]|nr:DUF4159 domain-containing protein [Bryobacteraceae bacterium]